MLPLLTDIVSQGKVQDREGNYLELHSHTRIEQCKFLQELIREGQPAESLEIGLAYGISSLAILDALQESGKSFHHNIIDPLQGDDWKDIGLLNVERAGFTEKITFYRKFSDQVVPAFYQEGRRIQFAYIDSTKVFDVLSADVYFINKILDVNGLLVLDDCNFPGIRMLVRLLSQHPAYQVYKCFGIDRPGKKLRLTRDIYYFLIGLLPFKNRAFVNYNFKRDEALGVNYNCIAFKKVKEDDRNWDWYCSL
jgi:predicted O-methyltransferase YrrM